MPNSGPITSRYTTSTVSPATTYTADELREWEPQIRTLDAGSALTLVYFNNHYVGQAVKGARDLGQLLLDLGN